MQSKTSEPSVSVCIFTYNHEMYIEKCIRSVLNQQYSGNIEVIVGVDCGTDNTAEIVEALAEKSHMIKPVIFKERVGPTVNCRTLMEIASLELVAHLDGDDFWLPQKLQLQTEILKKHPEVIAVYSNAEVVAPDSRPLGHFNGRIKERIDMNELFRRGNFLNHSSLIYRQTAKHDILSIKENWIDYRTHLKLILNGELAYINQPLLVHRWRTSNSLITSMPDLVINGLIDTLEEALQNGADPEVIKGTAGKNLSKLFIQAILSGNFSNVRHTIARYRQIELLRVSFFWILTRLLVSPFDALQSKRSRDKGIFFS